jgi:uncharacterized membrane protein|tara:strand:+ start:22 stop:501 length:480 start_codon:yes stop_codon:yes gene_type:complete
MKNKNVGVLILGISVVIILIIFLFNSAMKQIVESSCEMESNICPMTFSINQQTNLALVITGILVLVGLMLLFSKPEKEVIIRKIKERKKKRKIDLSMLKPEEKKVMNLILKEKTIFQADVSEKTKFSKVKVTRILDKLESKDYIERKRRGMTNIVILKE